MSITLHPRVWLNIMLDPIWPIERTMFKEVLKTESNDVRLIAHSQIENFNFAQRLERGREVFFYNIAFGIFPRKIVRRIKSNTREHKFFTVRLSLSSNEIVSCDLWLIDGQIGHLTYSAPVTSKRVKDAKIVGISRYPLSASGTSINYNLHKEIFDELKVEDFEEFTKNGAFVFFDLQDAYRIMTEIGEFLVVGAFSECSYLVYPIIDNFETSKGYHIAQGKNIEFLSESLIDALRVYRERDFS